MKVLALISNILMSIGLLPALWMAMFSPMLFDSGASSRTWTLFFVIIALPILIIITQIVSWVLYAKGNYSWAFKISLLPLLDLLLLVVLFSVSGDLK